MWHEICDKPILSDDKIEKSAKEMFEKNGFVKENEDKTGFDWVYQEDEALSYSFSIEDKTILTNYKYSIDMEDLKAINQQCKELGWL